jgi:hypothetical protein
MQIREEHEKWDRIGMTLKEIEDKLGNDKELYSCFTCVGKEDCKFIYDIYNTNGDCLAWK